MEQDVILLSTAYLPPISYFAAIAAAESVVIEQHETYPKQTYRNRCHIAGPNGLQVLSVPVGKPGGNKTKTCEVVLQENTRWKILHCRAFEAAYNSSPFFLYYRDQLFDHIFENEKRLLGLNTMLLFMFLEILGIKTKIKFSDHYINTPGISVDLRQAIHPKKPVCPLSSEEPYNQVFSHKLGFLKELSIIDLLANEGPAARDYIQFQASNFNHSHFHT